MAFLTQGIKGDKEIQISQISSIQFKKAYLLVNGYMQVAFVGGQEAKGGILQGAGDENTVMFRASQQPAFDTLRDELQKRINAPKPRPNQSSGIEDLENLASLRDRGIISEGDFQKKKIGTLEVGRVAAAVAGTAFLATLIPVEEVRGAGVLLLFAFCAFILRPLTRDRFLLSLIAAAFLSAPSFMIYGTERAPDPAVIERERRYAESFKKYQAEHPAPPKPAATATPNAATIPGLQSGDVTASFAARGYDCDGMQLMSAGASWTCTKGQGLRFEMVGGGPTRIEYLTLSAMNMTTEEARRELQFLATVDFHGGSSEMASEWVAANIRKGAITTFGDVEFRLVVEGSNSVRTLSIASSQSRYFQ
ncbi:MAG: SHOCT domain-containing protein [Deltaproteobacteria bacterium]|nr:SHOCT domain-containing protein [Deltaproteobacteria bacterium]